MPRAALFRPHELAVRTLYAELKERLHGVEHLTPGTPGTIKKRVIGGTAQFYRVNYAEPGDRRTEWVAAENNDEATKAAFAAVEAAQWVETQVKSLRKLGFQVADKNVARVLVELFNRGLFDAGLTLVGRVAVMAWFNELGIIATTPVTRDVDIGRRGPLQLAAPLAFMRAMQETGLPFFPVPGMPSHVPSTTMMTSGREGLRMDLLVPGKRVAHVVPVPELHWHAQAIPHLDYLLAETEDVFMLAGSHAVRVRVPTAARMVWHKFYASADVDRERAKAEEDIRQGLVLAVALADDDPAGLQAAFEVAPKPMVRAVAKIGDRLLSGAEGYPILTATLNACLSTR
jgi:hypothetical protein